MYGMVLMAAMTGSPDAATFGNRGGCDGAGCHGAVLAGCHGGGLFGKRNGCDGGGLFGKRNGCDGGGLFSRKHGGASCFGSSLGGCTGVVVAGGCTGAPVVVTPAAPATPCCAPAPQPCCDPCASSGRRGLFGKKKRDCATVTCAPAPCCTSGTPGVIVMPATGGDVPKNMDPKKTDTKKMD